MITLITMSQGNPIALERTLACFQPFVSEIVFGDLTVFPEDHDAVKAIVKKYNGKIVRMPFNYIFQHGFSACLNLLATNATKDYVLYMNVSEVIDPSFDFKGFITDHTWNMYFFDHPTEKHRWYRLYHRKQCEWRGIIHEEVHALPGYTAKMCPLPSFRMVDTEKDMNDSFKAKVYNDVKELVYFQQYCRLVEDPTSIDVTHKGWVDFAKDGYPSLKQRLQAKGARYEAFQTGNLSLYLDTVMSSPDFQKERFESNTLINYQGARHDML